MGAVMKMNGQPLEQRPLPHDIEAEQVLLGAIMMNNDTFGRIAQHVDAADFYDPIHSELFDAISAIIGGGKLASPVTLKSVVSEIAFPEGLTGAKYLALLSANAAPASSAADYAKFIRDAAIRRRLYLSCERTMQRVLEQRLADSAPALLDEFEGEISDLRPASARAGDFETFERAATRAVDMASRAYQRGGVLAGLSTGLTKLDDALGGLMRSDLLIIGGRPAMGKTALAVNIAYAVARDLHERRLEGEKTGVVAFNSLEMPSDQLAQRILAEHSKVSGWRIRKGKVSEGEFTSFAEAASILRALPMDIDATASITIGQLAMRARALKKRKGIELLVVDYLQLLRGSEKRREANRVQEVTEITTGLKTLAKELEIPVIALSQVSRDVEKRDDKRPKLSDLRESGSVEQDADVVMFVYRDEYYLKQAEPKLGSEAHNEWTLAMERAHGRAEIIIGKNRHGPADTIEVGYEANLTRFKNELPEEVLPPSLGGSGKRERAAKLVLQKESTTALGVLKSLVRTNAIENDGHVDKAKKGTKLVSYTLWREKCAVELLDPDKAEKGAPALMEKVVKDLMAPSSGHEALIGRAGSKDAPYVWIVEKA